MSFRKYSDIHQRKSSNTQLVSKNSSRNSLILIKNSENDINVGNVEKVLQTQDNNESRLAKLENKLQDCEDKIENQTQMIKMLQNFADSQEEENQQLRAAIKTPLQRIEVKVQKVEDEIDVRLLQLQGKQVDFAKSVENINNQFKNLEKLTIDNLSQINKASEVMQEKLSDEFSCELKALSYSLNEVSIQMNDKCTEINNYIQEFRLKTNQKYQNLQNDIQSRPIQEDLKDLDMKFTRQIEDWDFSARQQTNKQYQKDEIIQNLSENLRELQQVISQKDDLIELINGEKRKPKVFEDVYGDREQIVEKINENNQRYYSKMNDLKSAMRQKDQIMDQLSWQNDSSKYSNY